MPSCLRRLLPLLFCLGLHAPEPAMAKQNPFPYPRVACYGVTNAAGRPFIKYVNPLASVPIPPYDSTLDTANIRKATRFQVLAFSPSPALPYRPDILVSLRSYKPTIKLLAYCITGHTYPASTPAGSEKDYPTRLYEGMEAVKGYIYCLDHPTERWQDIPDLGNSGVDFSRRNIADSLYTILKETICDKDTTFDGIHLDTLSPDMAWTDGYLGHHIDYARAGYTTLAQMDSARAANCFRLITRLRTLRPDFIITANGPAPADERLEADGWLWEGFDQQAYGGTGWDAMFAQYQPNESYAWLKYEPGTAYYGSTEMRLIRYCMGTAALGPGMSTIGEPNSMFNTSYSQPYTSWWYDEASVTHYRDGGLADTTGAHTGWLGLPTGAARKLASGCWMREFTNGIVLVNPQTSSAIVTLPKAYTRIRGVRNPTTNNGQTSSSFTLAAKDALFLLTPVCKR